MNQKLGFLCFRGIHNSFPSFWAMLGYSRIKIDHVADSLLKLQIKIGVHFLNVELLQLLTPGWTWSWNFPKTLVYPNFDLMDVSRPKIKKMNHQKISYFHYYVHVRKVLGFHDFSPKTLSSLFYSTWVVC